MCSDRYGTPGCPGYDAPVTAPILVTGSHRSGTTWTGKMLAEARGVAYVHEPFNPQRSPGWMGLRVPYWYLYVCPDNEAGYVDAFERVLDLRYPILRDVPLFRSPRQAGQAALEWARALPSRSRRPRVLVKDPIALFSTEWLAKRFGVEVLVLVRHPAAFTGSLKRLGWTFDFRNWADQSLLLRDLLAPYVGEIRRQADRPGDVIDQAILMWNAIHHVVRGFRERHPSWTVLRYEDLASRPLEGFRHLYGELKLEWNEGARRAVERSSSPRNPDEVPTFLHRSVRRDSAAATRTWTHRLTEEERARVRRGTAEVAASFYSEDDWR